MKYSYSYSYSYIKCLTPWGMWHASQNKVKILRIVIKTRSTGSLVLPHRCRRNHSHLCTPRVTSRIQKALYFLSAKFLPHNQLPPTHLWTLLPHLLLHLSLFLGIFIEFFKSFICCHSPFTLALFCCKHTLIVSCARFLPLSLN